MLTGFRVQNFKAFEDTTFIELEPLTLLSGINSAGKSSILQALLLLKQTLESPGAQVLNPAKPLFLGILDSFLFGGGAEKDVALPLIYDLAFTYSNRRDADESTFANQTEMVMYDTDDLIATYEQDDVDDITFTERHDVELLNILKVALPGVSRVTFGKELTCHLKMAFAWGTFGYLKRRTARVDNWQVMLRIDAQPLLRLDIRPGDPAGSYKLNVAKEDTIPELQNLAFEQLKIDSFDHFLPESFIVAQPEQADSLRDVSPRLAQFLRQLFKRIQSDLSGKIYYLSSFREPPRPSYPGSSTGLLDSRGNNFPQVLWQCRDQPVYLAYPGLTYPDENRRYEMPLYDAVAWVLREVLGLEQSVTVQPVGKRDDILEVKVDTLGEKPISVTLADVGLGYNQILPVVVHGLLTPPGGLVIFEQPEIHLHPDVQAKLVQFFVGLAKAGRRVLVETHSSHMVDHLCLAIAKDQTPGDWLVNNASVLFVHPPDADHAGARIEPVRIGPYGHISNWPSHFMPDTADLYEAILKAGFAKRRVQSETRQ